MTNAQTIDGAGPYPFDLAPEKVEQYAGDDTGQLLKQRAAHWGDPVTTHIRIAQVWSGILGHEVSAQQVADCMVGLKLVRDSLNPDDPDSLNDAAGYTRIAQMIQGPK